MPKRPDTAPTPDSGVTTDQPQITQPRTTEAVSVPANDAEVQFEPALQRLEQLVTAMESGNMSLEESLTAFEQGIQLTRHCQRALESAEQRVQILLEQSDSAELQPLDPSSSRQ